MKSSRPPHPCLWNYFIEFCSFFGDWARFDEAGLSENVICTENGLKIHKGKAHKEVPLPEKLREPSTQPSLIVSPTRNGNRVEPCHNCDLDMSPSHLCQDDEDSEADEVTEAPIVQCLRWSPDFGTWSRSGPMSKYGPEKGPICLSSTEVVWLIIVKLYIGPKLLKIPSVM